MGSAIAKNLLSGNEVTVFNRSAGKADALIAAGAKMAMSLDDATGKCEVVFTMLADDQAAEDVTFGKAGLADSMPAGAIHVSLSTISIATARKLAAGHKLRGQRYVSAPVFGRPDAAEAKRLLVVVAGELGAIETAKPLLDSIGRHTYLAGDEGWHANLIKLYGNFMIACVMESFGESFAIMRKAGVDHHLFHEIMSELFGSPIYKNYGDAIASSKFEPAAFALKLGLKDIRLGLQAADELAVPTPFAGVLRDHFLAAMANHQGEMDWSSIGKIPAVIAGVED